MSIAEIVDEQDRIQRMSFWNDNLVRVVKSHGLSYVGARKLYQSMGEYMALDYSKNVPLFKDYENHKETDNSGDKE